VEKWVKIVKLARGAVYIVEYHKKVPKNKAPQRPTRIFDKEVTNMYVAPMLGGKLD
jgi:hypothetical protein